MPQIIHLIDPDKRRRQSAQLILLSVGGFQVHAYSGAEQMPSPLPGEDWVLLYGTVPCDITHTFQCRYTDQKTLLTQDLILLDEMRLPGFAEQVRLRFCSQAGPP